MGGTASTPVIWKFQSTPPARGATLVLLVGLDHTPISIHAPREGGDCSGSGCTFSRPISIHAPREGGDLRHGVAPGGEARISIHAPREGGDSKDAQFYLRIFDK